MAWSRNTDPEFVKRSKQDTNRRLRYGLEPEDLAYLYAAQNHVCAVCGDPPEGRSLSIDHDHETGRVRGLLCHHCNVALGHVRDDPERLMALVAYLLRHEA